MSRFLDEKYYIINKILISMNSEKENEKHYQTIIDDLKTPILFGTVIIGLISMLTYTRMNDPASINNREYNYAISQYADTNQDNLISITEKKEFNLKLIEGSGYKILENGFFIDSSGEKITRKNLANLISNYENSFK